MPRTLLLASFIAGCASGFGDLAAQAVRDSGGVAVRHYALAGSTVARWRLEATPLLTLGGSAGEGPQEFSGVRGAARLSNGHLVIADGGALELREFDASGRFVRAFGRRGSGPGEFEGLGQMARTGDTLIVADMQGRLHVWRPDATLHRTIARAPVGTLAMPVWMGRLSEGRDVFVGAPPVFAPWSGETTLMVPVVTRGIGADVRTVVTIPAFEVANVNGRQMPVYLGPAARMAAREEDLCVAWSKEWRVTCYTAAGRPRWRTTRAYTPRLVSEADKEAFRESYRRANRLAPPERVEAQARAFPFSAQRPPISRMELSPTGEVWVGAFALSEELMLGRPGLTVPDASTTWSVLARDGAWVADIELPARFRLLEVGRDYVVGLVRDADDVESVVVYRVNRQP